MSFHARAARHVPRVHVHVHSEAEICYWARELGCSPVELTAAVFAVGTPVDAVKAHLTRRRAQVRRPDACRRKNS